jgi:hypothetical protein
MNRPPYQEALARTDILVQLAAFDPHVAGTPPLELDIPGSDIDILCYAPDANAFAAHLTTCFGDCIDFSIHQWTGTDRPVIASFEAEGWLFEIFGQAIAVADQAGWRHFTVERRLLGLGGDKFHAALMRARQSGLKTEPAFAHCLGLEGDPYAALLNLAEQPDGALTHCLRASGHLI